MRPITQEEFDQVVKEMPLGKTLTGWIYNIFFSLLLVDDLGRSLAASRGIPNIWKIPLSLQCHFLHANPKGREGNPSKVG
jgi:hypothetical protein